MMHWYEVAAVVVGMIVLPMIVTFWPDRYTRRRKQGDRT